MPTRRTIASLATLLAVFMFPPAACAQSPAADPPERPEARAPMHPPHSDDEPSQPYHRPTEKQRLRTFAFDAFGPYAYADAAFSAGLGQAHNAPREWGQGADAFGVRLASNFGVSLVATTAHYALAEALREDTAYYRCECSGVFHRLEHALVSTLTARRGNDGHAAFSFSDLAAPYAGTMTATAAWYPRRFSPSDGFRGGNYALLGQAAQNLALEFVYGGPHTLLGRLGFPGLSGRKKDAKSSPPDPRPSPQ